MIKSGFDCIIRKAVEDGKPIFPEAICLTEEDRLAALEKGLKVESIERLKQINGTKYWSQYGNDPLDEENIEFKRAWIQQFQPSPELSAMLASVQAVISVDCAYRLKQYNDFTGITVTKVAADNNVFVVEARAVKVGPDVLIREIADTVDRYQNIKVVLIESLVYEMIYKALQAEMKARNKFYNVVEVKPVNNEAKPVHIRRLIPHYSNRRVFHAPSLNILEEQLLEFPKGSHDDVIDSLAYAEQWWSPATQSVAAQQTPEGSYAWWKKKTSKKPLIIGKLFGDLRRTNGPR